MSPQLIKISKKRFLVKFPYHVVCDLTVGMAITSNMRDLFGKSVRFSGETNDTAGTKRMDSAEMTKAFPLDVSLIKNQGLNPKDYILVELI